MLDSWTASELIRGAGLACARQMSQMRFLIIFAFKSRLMFFTFTIIQLKTNVPPCDFNGLRAPGKPIKCNLCIFHVCARCMPMAIYIERLTNMTNTRRTRKLETCSRNIRIARSAQPNRQLIKFSISTFRPMIVHRRQIRARLQSHFVGGALPSGWATLKK